MKNESKTQYDSPEPTGHWSILGKMALVAVAIIVVTNIHDIKRYVRISTM